MAVKVVGVEEAGNMILRIEETAKRRVRKKLIAKAREVQVLAIKMAPVDHGNLERAVKIRGDQEGAVRDELGRFAKVEVEVYVDEKAPIPERPGKTIGDYAYEMHEHLEPAGPLKLGPRSQDKQAGQPEQVGGKFMERAAMVVEEKIVDDLADVLDNLL